MDMGIADMFAGMDRAELNGKGKYMGEGVYTVALKAIKFKPEGFKGKSFIVEFVVTQTTNPDYPIGSSGSWVLKWDRPQAKGDAKALMLAILGTDPKTAPSPQQDEKLHREAALLAAAVCDPDFAAQHAGDRVEALSDGETTVTIGDIVGAIDGWELALECVKVKTQKGTDFTVHNWAPTAAP